MSSESTLTTSDVHVRSSGGFCVSLPTLSLDEKEKYHKPIDIGLTPDVAFDDEDLDEIIGEYRDRKSGSFFYYVRFQDGVAHKVRTLQCLLRVY
jgi:hypothetical protein